MAFAVPIGNRRRFLASLGGSFGLLAAQSLLAQTNLAGDKPTANHPKIDPLRPFAPRPTHRKPLAKNVIFLFLVGGPSSIDTFDYKPELQRLDGKPVPQAIRKSVEATKHANVFHGCEDKLMASPYRWNQYGETGMWISDLFPHVAKHADDLCFLHSLQADSNNHAPASYQLHTGDVRSGKASMGSWITYGLGSESENLPAYVLLFDAGPLGGGSNYANGFLPAAFQPTRLLDQGTPVRDLLPPDEFATGQRASLDLLRDLNLAHREFHPSNSELDARIASYELAYQMQSSAIEVGDFADETETTRESYGLNHREKRTQSFGRKCLLARRLIERGVRFVQLYDMPDKDGWDAHGELRKNHDPRALWTDQPIAALLADLKSRGLLDDTLVICASEFGRTPMMQGNKGRQHNAAGFTVWLAGGGSVPGSRIGKTDEIGLMAVEQPTHFRDFHATILTALGINYDDLFFEVNGRQERLTGVAGSAKIIPGMLRNLV